LQKELRQKSTHIKIATKTERKIDRHNICNKNSDKSTHIKIAVTEKNQYTQKLQQNLRENQKHIKIEKTATKSHTHTHKINYKSCDKPTHTETQKMRTTIPKHRNQMLCKFRKMNKPKVWLKKIHKKKKETQHAQMVTTQKPGNNK
jgi:hypothetical protein